LEAQEALDVGRQSSSLTDLRLEEINKQQNGHFYGKRVCSAGKTTKTGVIEIGQVRGVTYHSRNSSDVHKRRRAGHGGKTRVQNGSVHTIQGVKTVCGKWGKISLPRTFPQNSFKNSVNFPASTPERVGKDGGRQTPLKIGGREGKKTNFQITLGKEQTQEVRQSP